MEGADETWLVTGGAGFIGSAFVRLALEENWCAKAAVFDALTYAGNLENLEPWLGRRDPRLAFERGDVADARRVAEVFAAHRPARVFHFAAESHVDRSIDDPAPFVRTNVLGTQVMLAAARENRAARFVHVSTDEVYGALELGSPERFHEARPYAPSSPYAASKAGADFLVRAARHTHGQDAVITNCSNNYGPRQFPEKFLPLIIMNALEGKELPVYGDGLYVRDWIHVDDHCRAVRLCGVAGRAGETYCIGAECERANIAVARAILGILGKPDSLLRHVKDRPGHDRRYAIDAAKIRRELGWRPQIEWERGLRETIDWYRQNPAWLDRVRSGEFRRYYETHYGDPAPAQGLIAQDRPYAGD